MGFVECICVYVCVCVCVWGGGGGGWGGGEKKEEAARPFFSPPVPSYAGYGLTGDAKHSDAPLSNPGFPIRQ